jgi:hypothetical protein
MSPTVFPKLAPPVIDQLLLNRLLTVMSAPLKLLSSSEKLSHRLSVRPRSAGAWLKTTTCRPLFTSVTCSGM